MVRITQEPGGSVVGLWRPAELGMRLTYESELLKSYMAAKFVKKT
jgi:hypothetical protein